MYASPPEFTLGLLSARPYSSPSSPICAKQQPKRLIERHAATDLNPDSRVGVCQRRHQYLFEDINSATAMKRAASSPGRPLIVSPSIRAMGIPGGLRRFVHADVVVLGRARILALGRGVAVDEFDHCHRRGVRV